MSECFACVHDQGGNGYTDSSLWLQLVFPGYQKHLSQTNLRDDVTAGAARIRSSALTAFCKLATSWPSGRQ